MRHRLAALLLAAAAAGSLAPAATAALRFERHCSGTVDTRCRSDFCGIEKCTPRDCVVYSGVAGDYNTLLCAGLAREADPES